MQAPMGTLVAFFRIYDGLLNGCGISRFGELVFSRVLVDTMLGWLGPNVVPASPSIGPTCRQVGSRPCGDRDKIGFWSKRT